MLLVLQINVKITEKISTEVIQELDKMSRISLTLLNDSVEAFLRRDYYLADSIVDKTEDIRSLENEIILFLDKEKTSFSTRYESTNVYIKLILEDIRRTAEHASDIAEAAMNETVSEVIEKIPRSEVKVVVQ
jgi:phosphate uptake regulator